jgi:hypothetical protein
MDCRIVQTWLLEAEDPRLERCPAEIAGHVHRCPACSRLQAQLARLEQAWRKQPLPARADRARAAFLKRLPARPTPAAPRRLRFPRLTPPRWAVAALVLLTVGLSVWLFWPASEVQASGDLVEQLIDWDLQLSEAPTPAERSRIYDQQAAGLKKELQQAQLPAEDRELAEKLLDTGSWLTEHDDPLDEADKFDEVADHLVQRMQSADARRDVKEMSRLARRYRRIADRGIGAKLDKMEEVSAGGGDAEREQKLNRLTQRDARRAAALEGLLDHAPTAAHKEEIRGALESSKKHHKHGKTPPREKKGKGREQPPPR